MSDHLIQNLLPSVKEAKIGNGQFYAPRQSLTLLGGEGKPMTSRSFTLIELLLVIAVIAILASMLLPALNKARDSAKKIRCVNNLKQCSVGLTMYSQDWTGYYPAPYYGIDTGTSPWTYLDWQYAISDYIYPGKDLGSARHARPGTVFWCDSVVTPTANATCDPSISGNNSYRYGMNKQFALAGASNPKKICALSRPGNTCLLLEIYYSATAQDTWTFYWRNGNVPHQRKTNILYADMHASDLKELDVPISNNNIFWDGTL